jgi:alkylated DNA repair protein (DNA oxidative demethylase)
VFRGLAGAAAAAAGFDAFDPDACLINRYRVGARMGLHQDRDECDHAHPIVSVSLGCPVLFQLGGFRRSAPTQRVLLEHGDVLVFGGPSRLRYHGVLTLKPAQHAKLGAQRINLTFRRAR